MHLHEMESIGATSFQLVNRKRSARVSQSFNLGETLWLHALAKAMSGRDRIRVAELWADPVMRGVVQKFYVMRSQAEAKARPRGSRRVAGPKKVDPRWIHGEAVRTDFLAHEAAGLSRSKAVSLISDARGLTKGQTYAYIRTLDRARRKAKRNAQ